MNPQASHTPMKSNQRGEIGYYVNRFEEAMLAGEAVDMRQFLPAPESPLRLPVLRELIQSDLEGRWRRGEHVELERYLIEFPELGGVNQLDADVIYTEYRVRQMFGDRPQIGCYQARFPAQLDRKSTRLNSSHIQKSRMPSSA